MGFANIPCIGYKGLDTQEILHPLTDEVGDLDGAREIAKKLRSENFMCRDTIKKRFEQNYTENGNKIGEKTKWILEKTYCSC